jgi:hypothetical protein
MLTIYIVSTGHHDFLRKAINSVNSFEGVSRTIVIETSSNVADINKSNLIVESVGLSLLKLTNFKLPEVANYVLGITETTYLMRLDADDWLSSDFLEIMYERIGSTGFDAYIPSYIETDREENSLREVCRQQLSLAKIKDNPPHGACTVFRADFLRGVGGYSSKYDRQDGYYLWLKILRYGKFTCVPEAKFYYRQHGGNLTGNLRELWNVRAAMLIDECFDELKTKSYCVIPILELDSLYGKVTTQPFLGSATLLEYELAKLKIDCEIVVYAPKAIAQILPPEVRFVERSVFSSDQWADIQAEVVSAKGVEEGYLCVKNIEYPFVNPRYVEAAISAVHMFGANSCITVEELKRDVYRSSDNGLVKADNGAVHDNNRSYKRSGGIAARRISKGKIVSDDLVTSLPADSISAIRVSDINDFVDLKGLFE